tara:strand:- start:168 stop:962 length:795 start_codon:yes stop_codon:yes gene_type:complete
VRVLDLFSGIGGFSLAAKEVWGDDAKIVGHCDIDDYCEQVLAKNFPNTPYFNDVTKLTKQDVGEVDLICGGFPCQDISVAGKGLGIDKGERSGLWSEFNRLIGELRPKYAIIENVAAITSRGLNIVLRDLAKTGYDAEWQCIGANQIGARHRRERIWIVAYPSSIRPQDEKTYKELEWQRPSFTSFYPRKQWDKVRLFKSKLGRVAYGIPNWIHRYWEQEPTGVPRSTINKVNRTERLKALGNSVVPQIPMLIMKRIKEIQESE